MIDDMPKDRRRGKEGSFGRRLGKFEQRTADVTYFFGQKLAYGGSSGHRRRIRRHIYIHICADLSKLDPIISGEAKKTGPGVGKLKRSELGPACDHRVAKALLHGGKKILRETGLLAK
ncbi:hypothetical protein MesoLj113b_71420 (plasmid) [Mesorhizobium sp. 113-3-3]|nr:hypothetical protein MesoLj113b_71420 [Mesorhizobium sp. 113-3-3]